MGLGICKSSTNSIKFAYSRSPSTAFREIARTSREEHKLGDIYLIWLSPLITVDFCSSCLTSFEFSVTVVAFDLRICLGAYFVCLQLLAKYLIRALSVRLAENVKSSNICSLSFSLGQVFFSARLHHIHLQ